MAAAAPTAARAADFTIVPVESGDIVPVIDIINEAYEVETDDGVSPVGFKRTKRVMVEDEAEIAAQIGRGEMLKAVVDIDRILGVIAFNEFTDEAGVRRMYFGPLAVDPAVAKRGVGRALIGEVERRAAAAGCASVDISVVDVRSDILPWYEGKLGYVRCGTGPFPAPARTTKDVHFIYLRKEIQTAAAAGAAAVTAEGQEPGAVGAGLAEASQASAP
jgi:predicted N-acetyltransferase YhbS